MNLIRCNMIIPVTLAGLSLIACQPEQQRLADDNAAAGARAVEKQSSSKFTSTADNPELARTSPGKRTAPVTIRYKISGEAIIGQPLDIQLQFLTSATDQPMQIQYRIADTSALMMQHDQVRQLKLTADSNQKMGAHKVTVIPQAQGRSYLLVSATVNTANGSMMKQISIPVQVGTGGPKHQTNGKLLPAAGGTAIISMPAKED